jgi:predicted nucleotide-binding protein (sugar kinase/HSP70/actin superfamily)
MSDHAYALKSAFIACGVPAEVLPESDDETLVWGRKFTNGKECYPCTVTTGDIVRHIKKDGFNPNEVAFFMGAADGPCRFGQYRVLQRLILNELGYDDIPIVSLDSRNGYSDLGGMDKGFTRLAWKSMVSVDILQKACWEIRPYEVNKGETDKVYQESLKMICEEILKNGKSRLPITMQKISDMFKAIKVDKSQNKPIIGMVGEIFLRANRFSNDNIVRKVEELGGEIWVAPLSEWFFYTNFTYKRRSRALGRYKNYIGVIIKNWVQKMDEHELTKPFHGFLRSLEEPTTEENLSLANSYIADTFEGEAILSIGKGIDYAKNKLAGVINTIPFTCLPGNIVSAVSKRVREDYDNIPWLNVAFDGTEQTTAQTRLEAFMYQTKLYNDNKKKL